MKRITRARSGFTIVELLIVIVVIGILAAITLIAYNGIQNRAKLATVQSDIENSVKSLEASKITNAATLGSEQYPANLVAANLKPSSGSSFGYTAYTTTAGGANTGYCFQTTNNGITYYTTAGGSPKEGSCTTFTNYVLNPSLEYNGDNLASIGNPDGRTISPQAAVPDAYNGKNVFRVSSNNGGNLGGYGSNSVSLPLGDYTASVWVRTNLSTLALSPYLEGTSTRTRINSSNTIVGPQNWTRLTYTFTITVAGTVKVGWLSGNTANTGTYVESDGYMLINGTTIVAFSDGDSPNWQWLGAIGSSTSSGPGL